MAPGPDINATRDKLVSIDVSPPDSSDPRTRDAAPHPTSSAGKVDGMYVHPPILVRPCLVGRYRVGVGGLAVRIIADQRAFGTDKSVPKEKHIPKRVSLIVKGDMLLS